MRAIYNEEYELSAETYEECLESCILHGEEQEYDNIDTSDLIDE